MTQEGESSLSRRLVQLVQEVQQTAPNTHLGFWSTAQGVVAVRRVLQDPPPPRVATTDLVVDFTSEDLHCCGRPSFWLTVDAIVLAWGLLWLPIASSCSRSLVEWHYTSSMVAHPPHRGQNLGYPINLLIFTNQSMLARYFVLTMIHRLSITCGALLSLMLVQPPWALWGKTWETYQNCAWQCCPDVQHGMLWLLVYPSYCWSSPPSINHCTTTVRNYCIAIINRCQPPLVLLANINHCS